MKRKVLIFISICLLTVTELQAKVIQAGSCERDSVYNAINEAEYGDTVFIPAGTAVWTEPIVIKDKSIFIIGLSDGDSKPTITDSISSEVTWQHAIFWFELRETDTVRISNLNFYGKVSKPYGFIMMRNTKAFRVDHCTFDADSLGQQRAMVVHNAACGVFDNNVINVRARRTTQGLAAFGDGDDSWSRPSSYGTINNFFVEDCVFNFSYLNDGSMDNYNGARVVFRNNIVNGTGLGWHGFDSGNYRSTFSFEIYNNVFNNDNASVYKCFRSRGGGTIIHNNVITGNYDRFFILSNYRSCPPYHGYHTGSDGSTTLEDTTATFLSGLPATNYVYKILTNEWDTVKTRTETTLESDIVWNTGDEYGSVNYPMPCGFCMGHSSCDSLNSEEEGYPCLDQVGRGTNQILSPVYAWNNIFKGDSTPSFTTDFDCERNALHIKKNRDYYENVKKEGYEPFVYPHPFRTSGPMADPCIPETLPEIIDVSGASRCGPGSVTLNAAANKGIINWYNVPAGGESMDTGNIFTTPVLNQTTSYYVDATDGDYTSNNRTEVIATIDYNCITSSDNSLACILFLCAYPNPFYDLTTISFQVLLPGQYTLTVFDISGRKLAVLLDKKISEGNYSVQWDGTDNNGNQVSSGMYFYELSFIKESIHYVNTQKMILMK